MFRFKNEFLKLALLGLCLSSSGVSGGNVSEAVLRASLAGEPLPRPTGPCWVSEVKAATLIQEVSEWIRSLNDEADVQQLQSAEVQIETANLNSRRSECSDYRMAMLTEDLADFGRRLWKLSTKLKSTSESEINALNTEKLVLMRHLQELHVFVGPDLSSASLVLHTFAMRLELLEAGFNKVLGNFYSIKPTHEPQLYNDEDTNLILDPGNTLADLVSLARKYPTAMSTALPQLVSNMYRGNMNNFGATLNFITSLTSLDHKVIGFAALYNQLRLNSQLETVLLTELAARVKPYAESVSEVGGLSCSVKSILEKLIEDIGPIMKFLNNIHAGCRVKNLRFGEDWVWTLDDEDYVALSYESGYSPIFTHRRGRFRIETAHDLIYATDSRVRSSTKRYAFEGSADGGKGVFLDWNLISVQGGKYFKIINTGYNEVLFADETEIPSSNPSFRRILLSRKDSVGGADIPENADLWTLDCHFTPVYD